MNASTVTDTKPTDDGADIHGVTLSRIELDHLITWHSQSAANFARCEEIADSLYHMGRAQELRCYTKPKVNVWKRK